MLIRTLTRASGRLNWQPGQVVEIDAAEGKALIAAGAATAVVTPGLTPPDSPEVTPGLTPPDSPEVTPGLTPAGSPAAKQKPAVRPKPATKQR